MRQVVQLRGICVLRTLLHGKIQTQVIKTYLQNPSQDSTATIVVVQAVYDRNVGGGGDMTWQPKQQQESCVSVC